MVEWLNVDTLATLLSGLALGGMVFFSFVMAPLIFRTLPAETAAALMRAAFPLYYRVMAALTGAAAVLIWYRGEAVALAAVCGVFVLAWLALLPRVNRYREAKAAGDANAAAAHARLHRLGVILNLAQLVVSLAVFMRLAA